MNEMTLQARRQAIQRARALLNEKPVFIDTETTGLDKTSEIVEISIVDIDGNIVHETLVKPSQSIPPSVSSIHHITNEMVEGKPTWPVAWFTIRTHLFGKAIGIYNEDFDLRMMRQSHERYKQPWKENLNTFCVMKLFAQYLGEWDRYRNSYRYVKLEQAGRYCKIDIPNSHRASDDTRLTVEVFKFIANTEMP